MIFLMFLVNLVKFIIDFFRGPPMPRPKISILIPYGGKDKARMQTLRWVVRWASHIPDSEIIIGFSRRKPFCKTEAFNNAARRARGKVFVLMDADTYMDRTVITKCADRIIEEMDQGNRLWFVPYRKLYRLTKKVSHQIIKSDPEFPMYVPDPPPVDWIDGDPRKSSYGRRYGAMVMIIPRQAYKVLGAFDERFRGWGSEDACILKALDTLWAKHKSTKNSVFHLWHPQIGKSYKDKMWKGQKKHNPNNKLAMEYHRASNHPKQMRTVVNKGAWASRMTLSRKLMDMIYPPVEFIKGEHGKKLN